MEGYEKRVQWSVSIKASHGNEEIVARSAGAVPGGELLWQSVGPVVKAGTGGSTVIMN